jgi:predicted DNA-binding transcriptional regulator YafY
MLCAYTHGGSSPLVPLAERTTVVRGDRGRRLSVPERTRRIQRLLKLMQALQSGHSASVEGLARLAGVSRRTVFRDIELLSRAGIPYSFDRVTKKYSAARMSLVPPVALTHAEAFALMLAARSLVTRQFVPDQAAAVSAGLKLESMLPTAILDFCGSSLERTEIRPEPASDPASIADTLPILQTALRQRSKVFVRYDPYFEQKVIDVTLHPYRLAYIHRGWYLIAYSEPVSRVQTFKVERILQLKVLEAKYRPDLTFNLDDYFGNAWLMIRGDKRYNVEIRFLKMVAGNVDEILWHKTQRTRFEEDGSLLFEVDVDGIDEIAWWVLGYGDQAQVLAPPELREKVAGHAERMRVYYNGDGRGRSGN